MSFVKYVSSLLESDHNKKFVAFFGLMVVNVSLLLIVTLSRASHTTYTYNPTSAICLAEMIKFSISVPTPTYDILLASLLLSTDYPLTNHYPAQAFTYFSATGGGGAVTEARSHMSRPLIMSYAVLALIYCVNNQVGITPSFPRSCLSLPFWRHPGLTTPNNASHPCISVHFHGVESHEPREPGTV